MSSILKPHAEIDNGDIIIIYTLCIKDPEGFGNGKLEIENARSDI